MVKATDSKTEDLATGFGQVGNSFDELLLDFVHLKCIARSFLSIYIYFSQMHTVRYILSFDNSTAMY
jgi:hypothetical protein